MKCARTSKAEERAHLIEVSTDQKGLGSYCQKILPFMGKISKEEGNW